MHERIRSQPWAEDDDQDDEYGIGNLYTSILWRDDESNVEGLPDGQPEEGETGTLIVVVVKVSNRLESSRYRGAIGSCSQLGMPRGASGQRCCAVANYSVRVGYMPHHDTAFL